MTSKLISTSLLIIVLMLTVKSATAKPWTVFDAVQKALSTHPQSEVAKSILEEVKGENRSSLSLPAPTLTTRYNDIPLSKGLSDYEDKRIGIVQDFEFPLSYIWRTKLAEFTSEQARHESQAVLLDLESEVRIAYLEAWVVSEQVRILEEYTAALRTFASQIRRTAELGEVTQFDAQRAMMEVHKAENEMQTFQRSKIAAFGKLTHLTNFDLTVIELVSPLESDPIDTSRIRKSNAFETNPEALIAKAEIGILSQEHKIASYSWLPELELYYFQEYRRLDDDPDTWSIQLELSIPIWFWWGGVGEIQSSKARWKRIQADMAVYRLEFLSSWLQLSQELKSAFEQYAHYQQVLLPMTEDIYNRAKALYRLREVDFLDVIRAQRDLKRNQLRYIEVASDMYENEIYLDRLRGFSIVVGID